MDVVDPPGILAHDGVVVVVVEENSRRASPSRHRSREGVGEVDATIRGKGRSIPMSLPSLYI
jgi:hypothetical protein